MPLADLRPHFSRFLSADPERLHFAAHSHHPWPDVSRAAQIEAWDEAARLMDDKWEAVLGPVLDEARGHIARHLALSDPRTLAIAPNTHEFLRRILSCLSVGRRLRVLTSDGEFHSFTRQIARLAEDGLVAVERVAEEPHASFMDRLMAAARRGHDLVWVSQVFFDSGFAMADLEALAGAAGEALLVIDGYHGFMARPTDLSRAEGRAFYIAGGYKYAMAGEGVCFMHCPPGWGERPRDTGWFAAFDALARAPQERVPYGAGGWRFMGATFDPVGLYRFNAVMRWMQAAGLSAEAVHDHALALQQALVEGMPADSPLARARLVVPLAQAARGNFLTFETDEAERVHDRLRALKVVSDRRGRRLRLGFGIYQTGAEVAELCRRLAEL